jgi:hypothetical protein
LSTILLQGVPGGAGYSKVGRAWDSVDLSPHAQGGVEELYTSGLNFTDIEVSTKIKSFEWCQD